MILIYGGAYQGKLDYAFGHYGKNCSVYQCTEKEAAPDLSKDIINSFHWLVLAQLRNEKDPLGDVEKNLEKMRSKIIICDDISCGIVPIDAEMRQWRESVGGVLRFLAKHSEEVIRLFCGIGTRIK